jgi:hypothetical protein
MRKLFFLLALLPVLAHAQSTTICVAVDCKDTLRAPVDTVQLNGSANGFVQVLSMGWKQTVGAAASLDKANTPTTIARGLKPGLYVFAFTYSVVGGSATLYDSVFVLPAAPAPTAIIQPVSDVTLPYPAAILNAMGSFEPSGAPLSFAWKKISGPANDTLASSGPLAFVRGLSAGKYIYQVTVSSANGSSSAQVAFTVNPPAVTVVLTVTIAGKTITLYSDGTIK